MPTIPYDLQGHGKESIVLCHGFLGSKAIWNSIVPILKKNYQLVLPDLPGHGMSETISTTHSMEFMAEELMNILQKEGILKAHFVGHSMGGYIGLAFLEQFPERCSSLTLVNSNCFADADEKKQNRLRSVELVARNRDTYIRSLIRGLFPGYYADGNAEVVNEAIQIGLHTSVEGVQAALRGMMNRPNRTKLFFSSEKVNLISGTADPVFDWNILQPLHDHLPNNRQWTYDGGHMSMFEDPEGLLKALLGFLNLPSPE